MPHVHIKAPAIEHEAAVAGRFLVVPVMKIHCPELGLLEKMVFDPHWPRIGMALRMRIRNQTPVFCLQPCNPVHPEGNLVHIRRALKRFCG